MFSAAESIKQVQVKLTEAVQKTIDELYQIRHQCAGVGHPIEECFEFLVNRLRSYKQDIPKKWGMTSRHAEDYDKQHSDRHQQAACPVCKQRGGVLKLHDARATTSLLASGATDPDDEASISLFDNCEYWCEECNSELEFEDILRFNIPTK